MARRRKEARKKGRKERKEEKEEELFTNGMSCKKRYTTLVMDLAKSLPTWFIAVSSMVYHVFLDNLVIKTTIGIHSNI